MTEETGTLAELNVKSGDVVECVENDYLDHIGLKLIIRDDGKAVIQSEGYYGGIFHPILDVNFHRKYCIVSRASATPKTWGEMTEAERRDISFSAMSGQVIEIDAYGGWVEWDGKTPLCETHQAIRVRPPEPKRETVTLYGGSERTGHFEASAGGKLDNDTHSITFDVINGKPDCASIRMEEL